MAMLAEPRRKKRVVNLRGKNEWTEDNNKFGQKLLEKMGWAKGKGLGAREDGLTDHIKVRFKDDNAGLGFQDKNDQWTVHESSFNGLLESLNGGIVDNNKLHSETSLEEKSKNLRSRLHYKRYTKGKDISQYSSKDLANIFGKKTLKPKEKALPEIENPAETEEVENAEPIVPGYSFVAAGNIKDYFNTRLAKKIGKSLDTGSKSEKNEDDCDYSFQGFGGAQDEKSDSESVTKVSFAKPNDSYLNFTKTNGNPSEQSYDKKSKKKKVNSDKSDSSNDEQKILSCGNYLAFVKSSDDNPAECNKRNKKLLKKNKLDSDKSDDSNNEQKIPNDDPAECNVDNEKKKSKKNKKKKKDNDNLIESAHESHNPPLTLKSSLDETVSLESDSVAFNKKSKKKNKNAKNFSNDTLITDDGAIKESILDYPDDQSTTTCIEKINSKCSQNNTITKKKKKKTIDLSESDNAEKTDLEKLPNEDKLSSNKNEITIIDTIELDIESKPKRSKNKKKSKCKVIDTIELDAEDSLSKKKKSKVADSNADVTLDKRSNDNTRILNGTATLKESDDDKKSKKQMKKKAKKEDVASNIEMEQNEMASSKSTKKGTKRKIIDNVDLTGSDSGGTKKKRIKLAPNDEDCVLINEKSEHVKKKSKASKKGNL